MASEYSMRAKPVQTFPLNVLVTLLPFAAGYAIYGFAGALNAQLTGHIMSEFALEAAELNALTKVLLWIVMLVQLPLGVMVDRYGPRSVQGTCLCVAALGAALLTVATGRLTLALAICLIAIGIASTLVAGLKALVLSSRSV